MACEGEGLTKVPSFVHLFWALASKDVLVFNLMFVCAFVSIGVADHRNAAAVPVI